MWGRFPSCSQIMTEREQTQAFMDDIQKVIDRYCDEYELANTSAIGALQMKIMDIYRSTRKAQERGDI